MSFSSIYFWLFFALVLLVYYILPQRLKWLELLVASIAFYLLCDMRACFVLLLIGLSTFYSAKILEKAKKDKINKILLVTTIFVILVTLGIFKYSNFLIDNVNYFLSKIGRTYSLPEHNLLLPIGISFYSFKALSYVLDVAWHKRNAERSFGKVLLYLAFFPQIMAGPIERSGDFLEQLHQNKKISGVEWERVILQIGWGLFEKIVIADRLGILVDTVYNGYEKYAGWQLFLASIAYTLQILSDFDGYSNMAIGVARAFGFVTKKNFDLPYFSLSIKEFWRRWHISLSSWFKDYLYIPLGGNRGGKIRKYRNLIIVFACSGLWHGAGWNFIIWGCLHGIYQVIGDITGPIKKKITSILHISTEVASYKLLQGIITFMLVNFAWIFFRIDNWATAFNIIKKMFSNMNLGTILTKEIFYSMGLDQKDFCVCILALGIWGCVSLLQKYKSDLVDCFKKQNLLFRWIVYYALIFAVIIFGVYGGNYSSSNFIYVSF